MVSSRPLHLQCLNVSKLEMSSIVSSRLLYHVHAKLSWLSKFGIVDPLSYI